MSVRDTTPGVTLSREQTAQLAYAAGARGDDLVFLTGVPQGESEYRPGMHRTDSSFDRLSGDRGLWQINYIWDRELINAGIIRSAQDLFDPMVNARAAIYVLRKQGRQAWFAYDGSMGGNDSINWGAARQAVQNAGAQGTLGQDWQSGQTATQSVAQGAQGAQSGQKPAALPSDGRIVRLNGALRAVFDIGNGTAIWYSVSSGNVGSRPVVNMTHEQYNQRWQYSISAGDAEELSSIPAGFGTFGNYWNSILNSMIGTNNPARHDPDVIRVLAQIAARPDMSTAERQNLMQSTKWWQTHTQGELAWNDLSPAEQTAQRNETAARMVDAWRQFTGENIAADDARITDHLEAVASGKMGFGSWTSSVVKSAARDIAESPWSRTLRDEQEEQRQRGVDIENTARRVRETARTWGLPFSEKAVQQWGRLIVEGKKSDKDLLDTMEKLARGAFPGLPEGIDTETFASQYTDTYRSVLEREASVFTPEIQHALRQGKNLMDFERELTMSPEWRKTKNADQRSHALLGQVGEMFGFTKSGD
jgi:hypothetical protein